jgi:hypothetical protein
MGYLLFEFLLLELGKPKGGHFGIELLPVLSLLLLELDHFRVALLNEVFGCLHLLLRGFRNNDVFQLI